jgi:protein-L-isoaspartate(D-aspartate) O-methyltransferase
MDVSAVDYSEARNRMVDGQLRPNRVSDPRVLRAMRELPRERFLPPHLAPLAYADEDVDLGHGRVLMEPLVIARLAQLAQVRPGETTLVIGAGTGYGAALLAACGATVTALEEDDRLREIARPVLAAFAPNVTLVSGPLAAGWPAGAPWDLIFIEGALTEVPAAVAAQLRPEAGRLITVLAGGGRGGAAVEGEVSGPGLRLRPAFDCATPVLPQFMPKPKFVF